MRFFGPVALVRQRGNDGTRLVGVAVRARGRSWLVTFGLSVTDAP